MLELAARKAPLALAYLTVNDRRLGALEVELVSGTLVLAAGRERERAGDEEGLEVVREVVVCARSDGVHGRCESHGWRCDDVMLMGDGLREKRKESAAGEAGFFICADSNGNGASLCAGFRVNQHITKG